MKSRLFSGRALAGFGIACAVAATSPVILQAVVGNPAYAEDEAKPGTVSPEVGKPLQAARTALQEKKFGEALAKLKEADSQPKKTPYEQGLIEQMRLIAAVNSEELSTATKAYDYLAQSGELQANQKTIFAQAIAGAYMKAKELGNAATWYQRYFQAGGTDLATRTALAQAYYFNNDFANAQKATSQAIEAYNAAGQAPTEALYQLLYSCATKQNDAKAAAAAIEQLVAAYPKQDYWLDLIQRTLKKPGVSGKLDLDIYRFEDAAGLLTKTNDYIEFAELAIQAGLPGEAQTVVDKGYKANLLGQGAEADRHGRLRDMAKRSVDSDKSGLAAAETEAGKKPDGTGLVNTGLDYYGYGQYDKAITLIQAGIAKGGLKSVDEAKLHLGIVQLAAGKKPDAVATWKSMKAGEPSDDIARLWLIKVTGKVPS